MNKAISDIEAIMTAFRRARARKLEFDYYCGHDAAFNKELVSKYRCILDNLIPNESKHYLKEYTDCLVELYSKDVNYFYDWCFDDCQKLYLRLYGIAPVCHVGSPAGDDDADKDLLDLVAGVLNDDKRDAVELAGGTVDTARKAAVSGAKNSAAAEKKK
jgi:hypothetical protein